MDQATKAPEGAAELVEALADVEHQRWGDWQGYQHSICDEGSDARGQYGCLIIPAEKAEHWNRLIATPYQDLPEHSKQSDRDQVQRYWPLWVNFVTYWLIDAGLDDAAQDWQREMEWPG